MSDVSNYEGEQPAADGGVKAECSSLEDDGPKGTAVMACDIATGETETQEIVNDYCIVTDGGCRVDGVQAYANGTHVITVKGVKRG